MKQNNRRGVGSMIVLFLLCLWTMIQLLPLVFLLMNSIKQDGAYFANPLALPTSENITINGYVAAWTGILQDSMKAYADNIVPMYLSLRNSLVITIISSAVMSMAAMMAAYAIQRVRFRAGKFYHIFILVMICVPMQCCLLPLYQMYSSAGLLNKPWALGPLMATFSIPLGTLIMKGNMEAIPYAIDEAAEIDGCSAWTKFIYIIAPLMRGSIVTVIIVELNSFWSEMMFASLFIQKAEFKTTSLVIYAMSRSVQQAYSPSTLFAGMTMMITPLLLLYFIFNKQITKGMTLGAVK